ncbi:hypothetical protein ACETK8_13755 [Brevundimonas staleyi]|uniref:hypothetical protein n=1 Tax=Brevundimonas staleyi TaxID=74326 RepID=UPI0035A62EB8
MAAAADAPNLASAMNIGAFNLGNAIGAALGGAVIAGSAIRRCRWPARPPRPRVWRCFSG